MLLTLITGFILQSILIGQAPEGINYQAIVRDGSGQILANAQVGLRFTLKANGPVGTTVFQETHNSQTNDQGLVNVIIGQGSVVAGSFATIDWGGASHFLQVEVDNGSGYINLGTTQMVSVPYALYAKEAGKGGSSYNAGTGIDISGNTISNTGDTDASDDLTNASNAGGDVSGTFNAMRVEGIQGRPVSNAQPTMNQVLKWDGSNWVPDNDIGGGTGDNWGTQVVQSDATLEGNGTGSNLLKLARQGASNGEILKWDGTSWIPASDENTIYTAGTGLSLTGSTLNNTGDVDPSNDITNTTAAGGDLSGTYPDPSISAFQGMPFIGTTPDSLDVMKWTGSAWTAMKDSTDDGDWIMQNFGPATLDTVSIGTFSPEANFVVNGQSVLFGQLRNGSTMLFWGGPNRAFRSGRFFSGLWSPDSMGLQSFGSGLDVRVTGDYASGFGRDVDISGQYSFSAGGDNTVTGDYSAALGRDLIVTSNHSFNTGNLSSVTGFGSGAIGTRNHVGGSSSVAFGAYDTVTGNRSIAVGNRCKALGSTAVAMGDYAHALDSRSVAIGNKVVANDQGAVALGQYDSALGQGSVALGNRSIAVETYSIAGGDRARAAGSRSISLGTNTLTTGYGSVALGNNTVAGNYASFATGYKSEANGRVSTAMGYDAKANGYRSVAIGEHAESIGNRNLAFGHRVSAVSAYEIVLGRYNELDPTVDTNSWVPTDRLFTLGNGNSSSNRSNAMVILKNGNIGIGSDDPNYPIDLGPSKDTISFSGLKIANLGNLSNNLGLDGDIVPFRSSNSLYDLGNSTSTEHWDDVVASDFVTFSDERLKEGIQPLSNSLHQIMELSPVQYRYTEEHTVDQRLRYGLIAQEVQQVLPNIVMTEDIDVDPESGEIIRRESDYLSMSYMDLIAVLIGATQDQQGIIEGQANEIAQLKKENAVITALLDDMQQRLRVLEEEE